MGPLIEANHTIKSYPIYWISITRIAWVYNPLVILGDGRLPVVVIPINRGTIDAQAANLFSHWTGRDIHLHPGLGLHTRSLQQVQHARKCDEARVTQKRKYKLLPEIYLKEQVKKGHILNISTQKREVHIITLATYTT